MKRAVSCLSLFLVLAGLAPAASAGSGEVLYACRAPSPVPVYAAADRESPLLGRFGRGERIPIVEVAPDWLSVRFEKGPEPVTGYIRRKTVHGENISALDPAAVAPFPAVPCQWLGWVAGEAVVRAAPGPEAEALLDLGDGTRLALIDIVDGWGRLIFKRQYGYVDTSLLSELQPLAPCAETAAGGEVLAAYTSFYKLTRDEANLNRIRNLKTACERLFSHPLPAGGVLDFNRDIGPYSRAAGYLPAIVLVGGGPVLGYGGGTCQVSSTLYNAVLQLPGLQVLRRRPHGPEGAAYLPLGADAAVGTETQNFIFRNAYPFGIRVDGTVSDGALTLAVYRHDLP